MADVRANTVCIRRSDMWCWGMGLGLKCIRFICNVDRLAIAPYVECTMLAIAFGLHGQFKWKPNQMKLRVCMCI